VRGGRYDPFSALPSIEKDVMNVDTFMSMFKVDASTLTTEVPFELP